MSQSMSESSVHSRSRRGLLGWALRLIAGVAIMAAVISSIDGPQFLAAARAADPGFVLAALVLTVPNLTLQYLRWKRITIPFFPEVRPAALWSSLMCGLALGFATPARLGEFGGRTWALGEGKTLLIAGLTLFDKLLAQWTTIILGLCAFAVFSKGTAWSFPGLTSGALVLAAAAAAAVWFALRHASRLQPRLDTLARRFRFAGLLSQAAAALARFPRGLLFHLFFLNGLFYATFTLQYVLLLEAFHPLPLLWALTGSGTLMLFKTLIPPFTLAELGIREGVAVFVFTAIGVPGAAALQAALLLFVINLALPAIVGILFLRRARKSGGRK